MISFRYLFFFAYVFLISFSSMADEPVWKTYRIATLDKTIISVKALSQFSMADKKRVFLEFINEGDEPFRFQHGNFNISYDEYRKSNGRPLVFLGRYKSASIQHTMNLEKVDGAFQFDPGTHELIIDYFSDKIFSLPSDDGIFVKAHLTLYFKMEDGTEFRTRMRRTNQLGGINFQFSFVHPDEEEFELLKQELHDVLLNPPERPNKPNTLKKLLKIPTIQDNLKEETIRNAIKARFPVFRDFEERKKLAVLYIEKFGMTEKFKQFLLQGFTTEKPYGYFALLENKTVWDPDFLEEIISAIERGHHSLIRLALDILEMHYEEWSHRDELKSFLSSVCIKENFQLSHEFDYFYKKNEWGFNTRFLAYWAFDAEILAKTMDKQMIPLLEPFLDAKKVARYPKELEYKFDYTYSSLATYRVCDVALEAIVKILEEEDRFSFKDYSDFYLADLELVDNQGNAFIAKGSPLLKELLDLEYVSCVRDEMIEDLKNHLAEVYYQPGEVDSQN